MTDRQAAEPQTGMCWFCHREVPWGSLIAGYDTWDEQRLACNTCNDAIQSHGFVFTRAAALVPDSLDVERLARALIQSGMYLDAMDPLVGLDTPQRLAETIAVEYAALREGREPER